MKRIKTIAEFEQLLQDHDWYYAFSDDKRYYAAQKMMEERIVALTDTSRVWKDLYLLYCEAASPVVKMSEEEFLSKRKQLMEDYLASIGN
jgi:hypothetical protein